MDTLPLLSEDLITELELLHPPLDSNQILAWDEREIRERAAKRAVVEYLIMVRDRTKDEALNVYSEST